MNILFTRFPLESANGGAENQTMWLIGGLRDRGHTVSFLGSCPILLRRFSLENIDTKSISIGKPPVTKYAACSFLWRRKKMFQALVQEFEAMPALPDAVCMLSLSEKILMTEWLGLRGIKVFWIEHDRIGAWLSKNPWLPSLKAASKKATMICVSELSRQKYIGLGFDAKRIIAIPNGVTPPSPNPFPRRGKGDVAVEEIVRKKPVHKTILKFARSMRKEPTEAEELLWNELRFDALGVRFRRQHPVQERILDFYCHDARLGIEIDGEIHNTKERQAYDQERSIALEEMGVRILRFSNEEVLDNIKKVLERIQSFLSSSPHPSGEGPGVGERHERNDGLVEEKSLSHPSSPSPPPPSPNPFPRRGKGNPSTHVLSIGTIARLSPEKGIDVLITAIADLPEVTLSILGQGPEETFLRVMIEEDTKRVGVSRIMLKSAVPDINAFMSSLDVLVLASTDHDPFGLVAAEAMMRGIPVIVTDQCGIAGYLRDGIDALIVEAGSPVALKDAIVRLFDASLLCTLSEKARETAKKLFGLEKMVDAYSDVLHRD